MNNMYSYELWGNDTFSNETYLCGTYRHYSSAWRAMKKLQLDCKETQGEGLSDTFWIERKELERHVEERCRRQEFIDSIHEKMNSDMESVMKHIAAIYLFAKDLVDDIGAYECPLADVLGESDLESIRFIMRRQYGSRSKYELALYVKFCAVGECTGLNGVLAWGTMDEIRRKIESPGISVQYLDFIFKAIRKHYYSRL